MKPELKSPLRTLPLSFSNILLGSAAAYALQLEQNLALV